MCVTTCTMTSLFVSSAIISPKPCSSSVVTEPLPSTSKDGSIRGFWEKDKPTIHYTAQMMHVETKTEIAHALLLSYTLSTKNNA